MKIKFIRFLVMPKPIKLLNLIYLTILPAMVPVFAAYPLGGSGIIRNGMDIHCCSEISEIFEYNRSGTRCRVIDRWNYCRYNTHPMLWVGHIIEVMEWKGRAERDYHCVVM